MAYIFTLPQIIANKSVTSNYSLNDFMLRYYWNTSTTQGKFIHSSSIHIHLKMRPSCVDVLHSDLVIYELQVLAYIYYVDCK